VANVTIHALKNGPLMVKGEVDVLDSNGQVMQTTGSVVLCRCGKSAKKPFCDGTHRTSGFDSVCVRQPAA
jgi:CDGSH-type Zn-finger protein